MLNLAYIGAKILNLCPITGFVYFCFKINKAWHWSKIQICGANGGLIKHTTAIDMKFSGNLASSMILLKIGVLFSTAPVIYIDGF